MPELAPWDWTSGEARIAGYCVPELIAGERPVVVMIHGAMRSAANLRSWPARLAELADVYLMDLPGHGRSSPVDAPSVAALADRLAPAIADRITDRSVFLVGESAGGLVALALAGCEDAGPVRAVLALDPPLTTRKLWTWRVDRLRARREAMEASPSLAAFDREVFGIEPADVKDRIYYDLIARLRIPATIARGDRSVFSPGPGGAPAVFDDVDQFVLAAFYPGKVEHRLVSGAGHVLLEERPDVCVGLVRELLNKHPGG